MPWIGDLARRHEVARRHPRAEARAAATACPPSRAGDLRAGRRPGARLLGARGRRRRGAPLQVGWMMPRRTWRAAQRASRDADVVLAITTRSLRGAVGRPLVIDHVDALSLNMERRSHGDERLPVAAPGTLRGRALSFVGAALRALVHGAIATAEEDAAALPPNPPVTIVPAVLDHVDPAWAASQDRPIDVVLSGNMRYPAEPPRGAHARPRDPAGVARAHRRRARRRGGPRGGHAGPAQRRGHERRAGHARGAALGEGRDRAAGARDGRTEQAARGGRLRRCGRVLALGRGALRDGGAHGERRAGLHATPLYELLSDPRERAALVAASQTAVDAHRTDVQARRVEALLLAAAGGPD